MTTQSTHGKAGTVLWNDPRWMEYDRSGSASFGGLQDGFDDWVEWLRSILPAFKEPFTILPSVPLLDQGETAADESCATPPLCKDEDRWQDDGGESAESV